MPKTNIDLHLEFFKEHGYYPITSKGYKNSYGDFKKQEDFKEYIKYLEEKVLEKENSPK